MTDTVRKYALKKIEKNDFDCAKEYTLSMFSGKYKIVIIYHLFHDGKMRFNQIQRILDNSTHKVLTQQLKELVIDGIVKREEKKVKNRKAVFYSLTTVGNTLIPIIDSMFNWGTERLEQLKINYKSKNN
ncbi:winged helix-turn-helix transcriptional regulator [Apilactobacillus timberlakei]|uniref:winged helix-turn-helix transcriptional regulator n=1 Tax=Apilactobacillus timberlakei TaxID=2008380 RepID=UPI001127D8CA|nr:helix-turn-helix domain-containing protein [Apilactobacillus timberlakei]TPR19305.1 transcriptional regulator [Apilactobacillus timberlakei]